MIAVLYHYRRQHKERRIAEALPKFYFLGIKAFVILLARVPQSVVLRVISLYENLSGLFAATRTSGDLSDQLKRPLGGTQIRQPQADIDRNYADERDIW